MQINSGFSGFFRVSNSLIAMEEYFLCSFGAHSCGPTHYEPFGGPLARGYNRSTGGHVETD
jgi:hypothetical protein